MSSNYSFKNKVTYTLFAYKSSTHIHKLVGRVLPNGPGYQSSSSGRIIPKTQKLVLYTSLLKT